ncbi:glycosyltransferase family 39 protein [Lysobacter sp. TY2-98]|uniref:ArnT family glycosyltransferase n=1 Tax=Lysobacter sp. TY2-98 TaxID=2290922 RepID=UPI000E20A7BA|nr:glycosyltransferase family 39 protein [Lysobacter sp. TY2-98]AXK72325.1 glycosyltransferase family 39 protein [Lysobacter sp. TY2-98]
MQSEPVAARARGLFWALWAMVLVVKVVIAARLPLFVDEAFYWQEGQHPAAAYSDLPGLTAWLTRLGVEIGGAHTLALRMPFVVVSMLVPLLVVRIAHRTFGEAEGWQAGAFALLLPLVGSLGLLAVPDPLLALATLLCMDAGACLLRRVDAGHALELAAGLAIGALSHYRFIAVIAVGFVALLATPEGRRTLKDVRVIIAIALGAAAWTPLVWWNYDNADAGLRFQLVDRHPWVFHASGLWFIAIQALLVTPPLFVALLQAGREGLRSPLLAARWAAMLGLLVVGGFFVLGFFADTERVSFHWPVPGFIALVPLLPRYLAGWPSVWRRATAALAGVGLVAVLGYYVVVSMPHVRAQVAAEKWYPSNFAGWDEVADAARDELRAMPPGTRIVADNFKLGAELGFALGDPDIAVLDHPLNRKHGRAPQLHLWGLDADPRALLQRGPVLLAVGVSEVEFKNLHQRYLELCRRVGPLPAPRILNVDHGRQRLALFRLEKPATGTCTAPAMAWIDRPGIDAKVAPRFEVSGWAFRQGVGLQRIEATLDGRVVGELHYGERYNGLDVSWPGLADPNVPALGFKGEVDASAASPGRHWLGLRLHGRDGAIEAWPETPVEITR